jgi:hypothetical protein
MIGKTEQASTPRKNRTIHSFHADKTTEDQIRRLDREREPNNQPICNNTKQIKVDQRKSASIVRSKNSSITTNSDQPTRQRKTTIQQYSGRQVNTSLFKSDEKN